MKPSPDNASKMDPLPQVRRGTFWLGIGGVVLVATYWSRTAATSAAGRYAPLVLLLAGAYAAITGIEKIYTGWSARRLGADAAERARLRRAVWSALALGLVLAIAAGLAWRGRAPYWRAVASLAEGDRAAETLRDVAERHASAMQSGASGLRAVEAWRESSGHALRLRPSFDESLEAARYLSRNASGVVRARAENDTSFFTLCLEWMDLYQRVQQETDGTSMAEPPEDWGRIQNDIIERIQALPRPGEGR
jgi:hypothetical protein